MTKNSIACLASLFLALVVFAQQGKPTPPGAPGRVVVADTTPGRLQDVLFAANDDCEISINDAPRGAVSKDEFRYLKLAPGTYRCKAKSQATGDEFTETFTVTEDGTNEVFLDVLFVVDARAEEKRLKNGGSTAVVTAASTAKAPPEPTPAQKRAVNSREAQQETVNFLISNALLMKGGNFVMGNNRAPVTDESEHVVTIGPFYFSRYEVTQYQWESVMGYNPSINKGCATCPVENVSWEDAQAFVAKLNLLSSKNFRLPTEAEWEYVAKWGGKGEIEKAGGQEALIKKTAWYFSNAASKTHPVGRRDPSAAGIYDLSGNVSEWCLDWYGPRYYKDDASRRNPSGPSSGKEKVVRGGNFKDYVGDRFRPSFRSKRPPKAKGGEVGFRVVLEAGE